MKLAAISHLSSTVAPTGAEKSLAFLAESLAARDHETAVVAPGPWCLADRLERAGVTVAEIPSRACWLVQWGSQPLTRQVLRYLRWRAPDLGTRRMMMWLDRIWPEVVYVNCLPQLKGAAAAWALGLPVVWHVREILPPGRRRRWFARRLSRHARQIVAVSEAVAEWIRDEGLGDRVTVVHNGVARHDLPLDREAARKALGLLPDGFLLGFLGGMEVHKGAGELVRAAERAIQRAPELRVAMAVYGPEAEVASVRKQVAKSSVGDRFQMIPPVDDVWSLLSAVDAVAFTSIWPDSLPRTVMEAMAAGKPVVATDVGGVGEMVAEGETGFMVKPVDIDALADRMVRLAADPGLCQRLGAAAAERARSEFSITTHVDRMEKIFAKAAELS